MKTTKLIIALGMALLFSQSFAQDPTKGQTAPAINDGSESSTGANRHDLYAGGSSGSGHKQVGTVGNAYLLGDWQEGDIVMKDNTVITGNKYRYNIYTQQMQFINGEDTMAVANPKDIKNIKFADKVFIYTDYYCKGELKQGYFELLKEGECSLLKRWVVSYHLVEGEAYKRNAASNGEEFIRECSCYLLFGDSPAIALENRKKDFVDCFSADSESINAFMQSNKMKHKDQEDLVQIIAYYNQIQD